jgi:glycerol-1-phosphate dehydrogenase [NAD(P)+]
MQLPRKVIIGNNILKNSGEFIKDSDQNVKKIAIITGKNVKNKISGIIEDVLTGSKLQN